MTYFKELCASDLSDLGATLLSRLTIGVVFHGMNLPESKVESRLLTAFMSVADKAIREYQAGRNSLILYSESENRTRLMVEGLWCMENCINSLRRAFRIIDKFSACPFSFQINRTSRRFIQNQSKWITSIRDAIEHIDEDIAGVVGIKIGDAHLLAIDKSGKYLEISKYRLSITDLAKILRAVHGVGAGIVESQTLVASVGRE